VTTKGEDMPMPDPDNNPILQELKRMVQERGDGLVDLTRLWATAGRPMGRSPRQWEGRAVRGGAEPVIVGGTAGRADDPALVPIEESYSYIMALDGEAAVALTSIVAAKIDADPAGLLMKVSDPVGGLLALGAALKANGGDPEAARRQLTAEVARRSEADGVYAQESAVAAAQRALGSVKFVDLAGPTGR
jgi:hypothetical protein